MVRRQGTLSVGEAFRLFKASKVGLNKSTIENYELSYDIFLKDNGLEETYPIKDVLKPLCSSWICAMQNKGIRVASINHYITDIRVFLYWCMREGYLNRYSISLIKGQEPVMKFYTDDEVSALIKKPNKSELFSQYRTWVCVCFMLATGARASTIINIKISDIDFTNHEIIYRHLKNRQVAIIPLSKSLEKVLNDYLSSWKREKEDGWLFCDASENQCTVSSLRQALENYCNRRGVKSKGLHAFRHTFARGYILAGGNSLKLQKLLTHSTLEMTKKYVQLFGEDLKKDYEQFSLLDTVSRGRKTSVKRTL